jgi:hypothetical protein
MTEAQQSDALKILVLFIIGLAILGTIIALAWYFGVELPIQHAIAHHPPANDPDFAELMPAYFLPRW